MIDHKIVWFTGQPGSGKTTLATELKLRLEKKSFNVIIVDGDDLRNITTNKDYSRKGREENIKTAQKIAKFVFNKNFFTIVSLVAPYRSLRENFKNDVPVLEVYLVTSDIRGREHFFASDYQKPNSNFLEIDTGENSINQCIDIIYDKLNAER